MTRIAVVGAGNVGRTLAGAWERSGHRVQIGVRHPETSAVPAVPAADAIEPAEVVVFAVPGGAMPAALAAYAPLLAGRIVIDTTNDVGGAQAGGSLSALGHLAEVAPTAEGFRAFNSVGWENMADPVVAGVRADLCYAGPDTDRRPIVDALVADVGFRPVYVGAGEDAHLAVDALATLWFALAFGRGCGRRLAFHLLHEPPAGEPAGEGSFEA